MKIMGVDQSFTSCGIVIIEDGKLHYAERFVSDVQRDTFDRAWQVANRVLKFAIEHKVEAVGLEGLAYGGMGNATRDLAILQGAIVTNLRILNGYDIDIIGIGTAKKLACGMGNGKKEVLVDNLPTDVREYFDKLGVKKTTGLGDLSDAYWIGMVLYNKYTK